MAELEPIYLPELDNFLHNPRGDDEEWQDLRGGTHETKDQSGWHFGAGDPEFWVYQDVMLKPGGQLLDVGTQSGRAAMFFALNGMDVTAYETEPRWVEHIRELAASGLPELWWDIRHEDFLLAELEAETFDTILFAQTFLHVPGKEAAIRMIDKAWDALKPGGVIWVRACGKMDSAYRELLYEAKAGRYSGINVIDDDVIEHPCNCSGDQRTDPSLFFEQMELLYYFAAMKNARIVHNQMIPEEDTHAMMYGEDFNRSGFPPYQSGIVTILAQKYLK